MQLILPSVLCIKPFINIYRMLNSFKIIMVLLFIAVLPAQGQEQQKADSLQKKISKVEEDVQALKKIQFTGYLQTQFQLAEREGIASFAGGNFPENSQSRFQIRRGRVKLTWSGNLSKFVTQIDITEKGIAPKDVYLQFTDPWLRTIELTAGLFNRPFGNEITMSSSVRESPERARIYQTLFPNERDAGIMLSVHPGNHSGLHWFKADAGFFNGTGIAADFDSHKDFIGRLSFTKENAGAFSGLTLGFSYYHGFWQSGTGKYYKSLAKTNDGFRVFLPDSTGDLHSARRSYYGINGQVSVKTALGTTLVRGEYLSGLQGGTSETSVSPSSLPKGKAVSKADPVSGIVTTNTPSLPAMERPFAGGLVYIVHTILQTRHQIVFKYDVYDPNTRARENEIGKPADPGDFAALTSADIRYDTYGLGYIFQYASNLKIMLYYDIVRNEKTALTGFTSDLKDNVLTIRLQYKF